MNKYEIAARLAAHDIYDGEIVKYIARTSSRLREDCDGCDDCNNAPLAVLKEIQEGKRYDANLARGEAEKYEAVLAEIEAAEKPEPASDDAPYPEQPAMRYASGEEPIVGDEVRSKINGLPYQITEVREKTVVCRHHLQPCSPDIFVLIRRAEAPEEAKDGDLHLSLPERLRDAANCIRECFLQPAGSEYVGIWGAVYDRLLEIAATAEAAK